MRTPLTPRQRDTLEALARLIGMHGYSPSTRELAKEVGTSANAVLSHVKALVAKGYATQREGATRTLRVAHWTIEPVDPTRDRSDRPGVSEDDQPLQV